MQNATEETIQVETFSALVATKVQPTLGPESSFLTRCGKPKTTDD